MNLELIEKIVPELRDALTGAAYRNIFQLGRNEYVLAFDGDEFQLLFVSAEPVDSRVYLVQRRLPDLKKTSIHPSRFAQVLEKQLSQKVLSGVSQIGNDRIIEVGFTDISLILQLTGKSSNLFLLDPERNVVSAARHLAEEAQKQGEPYLPPKQTEGVPLRSDPIPIGPVGDSQTLSATLDTYFQTISDQSGFEQLAAAARSKVRQDISKSTKLVKNLNKDMAEHGDAEQWKRFGDLLLANQGTAERTDDVIRVRDLFSVNAPIIEIAADQNDSIAEAAQKYFRRYTKARNARTAIESRLKDTEIELQRLENLNVEIESAIRDQDTEFLNKIVGKKEVGAQLPRKKEPTLPSGIRAYSSSDGFEILVGKKAKDNDHLTTRVAHSRDTWMHAADYPGSHVVVRNPNRKEIPHRTLIEAAQLAAFYSQGKKQPKAAVHYAQKKFVSKPKGWAPGLVRLASFKTILVEPKVGDAKPIIR